MKIYTRLGDDGTTGLYRQSRVHKSHPLIDAIGTVDELNALIGVVLSIGVPAPHERQLSQIQHHLFELGAELANRQPDLQALTVDSDSESVDMQMDDTHKVAEKNEEPRLSMREVAQLERLIDGMEKKLPELRQFILPGGVPAAASIHQARTVCRRAERLVEALTQTLVQGPTGSCANAYLNRLSDYLFVLARAVNAESGSDDVPWSPADHPPGK